MTRHNSHSVRLSVLIVLVVMAMGTISTSASADKTINLPGGWTGIFIGTSNDYPYSALTDHCNKPTVFELDDQGRLHGVEDPEALRSGEAYFISVQSSCSITLTGQTIETNTIHVQSGADFIGTTQAFPASKIYKNCDLKEPVWTSRRGFGNKIQISAQESIQPFQGYVVEARSSCRIQLESEENPIARVEANPTSGQAPLTVTFDASASSDPDGRVVEYGWNFGDGTTSGWSSQPTIEHTFQSAGTYDVILAIKDNDGLGATARVTITVGEESDRQPNASFEYSPDLPTVGETVTFTDTSNDPDGRIVSREWQFPDGSTSSRRNASYTFGRSDSFSVCLTVEDNDGNTDDFCQPIAVGESEEESEDPIARLEAEPTSGEAPLTVSFDATASSDPDGRIERYGWDFGDDSEGGWFEDGTIEHTYDSAGTYTVRLAVMDNDQNAVEETVTITVSESEDEEPEELKADFTWEPKEPKVGETVEFTGKSTSPSDSKIVNRKWSLIPDSDYQAEGKTATYEYQAADTFEVCLVIQDDSGDIDYTCYNINVVHLTPKALDQAFATKIDSGLRRPDTRRDQFTQMTKQACFWVSVGPLSGSRTFNFKWRDDTGDVIARGSKQIGQFTQTSDSRAVWHCWDTSGYLAQLGVYRTDHWEVKVSLDNELLVTDQVEVNPIASTKYAEQARAAAAYLIALQNMYQSYGKDDFEKRKSTETSNELVEALQGFSAGSVDAVKTVLEGTQLLRPLIQLWEAIQGGSDLKRAVENTVDNIASVSASVYVGDLHCNLAESSLINSGLTAWILHLKQEAKAWESGDLQDVEQALHAQYEIAAAGHEYLQEKVDKVRVTLGELKGEGLVTKEQINNLVSEYDTLDRRINAVGARTINISEEVPDLENPESNTVNTGMFLNRAIEPSMCGFEIIDGKNPSADVIRRTLQKGDTADDKINITKLDLSDTLEHGTPNENEIGVRYDSNVMEHIDFRVEGSLPRGLEEDTFGLTGSVSEGATEGEHCSDIIVAGRGIRSGQSYSTKKELCITIGGDNFLFSTENLEDNTLSVSSVQIQGGVSSAGSITVNVQGSHIDHVDYQLYRIDGSHAKTGTSQQTEFSIRGITQTHERLANGVYLMILQVHGVEGNAWTSKVQKVAILR